MLKGGLSSDSFTLWQGLESWVKWLFVMCNFYIFFPLQNFLHFLCKELLFFIRLKLISFSLFFHLSFPLPVHFLLCDREANLVIPQNCRILKLLYKTEIENQSFFLLWICPSWFRCWSFRLLNVVWKFFDYQLCALHQQHCGREWQRGYCVSSTHSTNFLYVDTAMPMRHALHPIG